jgi:hypothetical protein
MADFLDAALARDDAIARRVAEFNAGTLDVGEVPDDQVVELLEQIRDEADQLLRDIGR